MKLARVVAGVSLASLMFVGTARADDPPPSSPSPAPAPAPAPASEAPLATGAASAEVTGPALVSPRPTSTEPSKPVLVPAILAGAGVAVATVGIILVATAPKVPGACDSDARTCVRQPNQSNADFENLQEDAGRGHTQPIAGWVTIGIGGMLVAAGLLTYVFGPSESRHRDRSASTSTTPTMRVAPSLGGLVAVGTF